MSSVNPGCNIYPCPKCGKELVPGAHFCYVPLPDSEDQQQGATTAWGCCGNRTRDGHKQTCPKWRGVA